MIKALKLKTMLKIIFLTTIVITLVFICKNRCKTLKVIQTSNTNTLQYKILVDVEESRLYLFENDELIKTYKCSGGKVQTPSPIGTWKIISKAKWGEGFGRKFYGHKCSLG